MKKTAVPGVLSGVTENDFEAPQNKIRMRICEIRVRKNKMLPVIRKKRFSVRKT
jgi:hypothetical protein